MWCLVKPHFRDISILQLLFCSPFYVPIPATARIRIVRCLLPLDFNNLISALSFVILSIFQFFIVPLPISLYPSYKLFAYHPWLLAPSYFYICYYRDFHFFMPFSIRIYSRSLLLCSSAFLNLILGLSPLLGFVIDFLIISLPMRLRIFLHGSAPFLDESPRLRLPQSQPSNPINVFSRLFQNLSSYSSNRRFKFCADASQTHPSLNRQLATLN